MKKVDCFNEIYELLKGCVSGVHDEEEYFFIRRVFENEYSFFHESRVYDWVAEHEKIVKDYPKLVDSGQYYTIRNIIARLLVTRSL